MTLNLLAKVCLVTLLYNVISSILNGTSWCHRVKAEKVVSFGGHEAIEVGSIAVKDAINSCDSLSSSLSNVPECGSPWTYCDNGTCKCPDSREIFCLPSGQALVHTEYCVTFDEAQALTHIGQCVYRYGANDSVTLLQYYSLPSNVSELNDVMCGPFNRTGMLCGKCKDGYYPLVNSLDVNCVQCPNGWSNLWKFAMVAFLPLTVFYFIILLFRVNATSSQLHGFIYYCQGNALPPIVGPLLLHAATHTKSAEMTIRVVGLLYESGFPALTRSWYLLASRYFDSTCT